MWKKFSFQGSYKWIDKLDDVVDFYNHRVHRTIKVSPAEVTKTHEKLFHKTVYNFPKTIVLRTKFKLGDHVRISKFKGVFEKGYTPNFGCEIFKIVKINRLKPEVYYLEDYKGEPVLGAVYAQELTKVKHPDGYLIEKVIRKKGSKSFCKFLGFDSSHNAWIDSDTFN